MKSSLIILVICLVYVSATPINNNQEDASEKNLLNIVNEFDKEQTVHLFGGLSIEKSKNVRSMKSLKNNEKFVDRIERYFNTHELKFNWPEDKDNETESGRNQFEEARGGKSISESDVTSSLPKDQEEKTEKLVDLAMDSVTDFLKSHELQVKISPEDTKEIARSIEEGRGKMKKMMGPLMMALGAKLVALVPILLGGLALLATKALVVAKIAFLLAVSLSATKLLGGGSSVLGKIAGGAGTSGWSGNTAGWSAGGNQGWSSGSYPYARSLDAHDIAYNGQAPSQQEE